MAEYKYRQDYLYAVKNSENLYYMGYRDLSYGIAYAFLYKVEIVANQVAEDLNNKKRELSNKSVKRDFRVVKVEIREI
jgi:hypothetical protein